MRLILAMCIAEVLTMAGVFAFPALLPTFVGEWGLSKTQAGWIAGVYFGAYAVTAPPVLALTDRLDARCVYFGGALLAAAAAAGFALLANGFWSALLFRALGGAALAATYLPGLRVLMDRHRGPRPSRALSFYTASFSLGTALSFLLAGEIAALFGWRAAFAATAGAALCAATVPLRLSPAIPEPRETDVHLLDFRPVLANHRALAYVLGYGVHCWELFATRSWLVAFLAFSLTLEPAPVVPAWLSPTAIATASGLVAMAASIGGNELCLRFGRRRVITLVMLASALCAAGFGFQRAPCLRLRGGARALLRSDRPVGLRGADRRRIRRGGPWPARRDFGRPRADRFRLRRNKSAHTGNSAGRDRRRRDAAVMGSRVRLRCPCQLARAAGAQARPAHIGEYNCIRAARL